MRKRNWSKMHDDICFLIKEKLWFYPGHSKFARACKDWYRITKKVHGSCQETPVSMLLPYNNERGLCTLYINSENFTFELPELHDRWVHSCSKGWLATTDRNWQIILVNPYSRAEIQLPQLTGMEMKDPLRPRNYYISKIIISENPLLSPDCLIVAIMTDYGSLFACRPGDNSWTRISLFKVYGQYSGDMCQALGDVVFFRGKIFAVSPNLIQPIVIDYGLEGFHARFVGRPDNIDYRCVYGGIYVRIWEIFLVECSGDLLMVVKYGDFPQVSNRPNKMVLFKLYKFEEDTNTWSKVNNLGDKSLFLGASKSKSVTARKVPGCQPNCIYYASNYQYNVYNDEVGAYEIDNGVFSLEDDTFKTFSISHSDQHWESPAVWYQQRF